MRLGIAPAVTGATVTAVEVLEPRSLRRHPGPPEDFAARLAGSVLAAPERRGKFLWLPLNPGSFREMQERADAAPVTSGPPNAEAPDFPAFRSDEQPNDTAGEALVVHLGMSGQVLLRERGAQDARTRIRIDVAGDAGRFRLNFVDQRIFGSMAIDDLAPTADRPGERVPASVAHIARDPLDPHFDDRRFLARIAAKRTGVKRALLDQQLVSGIGNIYADEALWLARLHYDQPASTLSRMKASALLSAVREVFAKALAEGGTSFDTQYVNVNGESGYFAHSLNAYGQHGRPCPRCGTPMVREPWMNRNSHLCPRCQRLR